MTKKIKKINQNENSDFDKTNKKCYFVCANTCLGSVNLFHLIYNSENLEKIYIIKGHGESFILNQIAKKAEEKKYSVEYFLCPADIKKLNGIIIKELKTAVISEELYICNLYTTLKYPIILENIINLNDFYEETKLIKQKKEIFNLTEKKNGYNKLAYKFLKVANELCENIKELSHKYIDYEKLDLSAGRLINKYIGEKNSHNCQKIGKNTEEYRFINSVSQTGLIELDTFENEAKKIFYISDKNFSGLIYINNILEKFSGLCKVICLNSINPKKIQAIYLKDLKILFIIKNRIFNKIYDNKYSFINMERFIDKDIKKENKQKLRFMQKCYRSIIDEAVKYFTEINNINNTIENIYESAVKLEEKNKYTEEIVKKIFL